MPQKAQKPILKKISSILVFVLLWNFYIAPSLLGLKTHHDLMNLKNAFFQSAFAQETEPVPPPVLTPPSSVSNIIPRVQGQKLASQDEIIMCTPETAVCPGEGISVAAGGQLNFQVLLQPLVDGRNDFAFFARTGDQYSAPEAFSVFYVSEESIAQDVIPPELESCLGEQGVAGYASDGSVSDEYGSQTDLIYDSLPDDNLDYGAYGAYNDPNTSETTSGISYTEAIINTFTAMNPFQSFIPAQPAATSEETTVDTGDTSGPSSYAGGYYPSVRISETLGGASQALGGFEGFQYCVTENAEVSTQDGSIVTSTSTPGITTTGTDTYGDYEGYYDEDGNFVLFTEDDVVPIVDSEGNEGIDSDGDGIIDTAFTEIGRDYADPTGSECTSDIDCGLEETCQDGQCVGGECVTDFDCDLGQICDSETGTCVAGCNFNDDCEIGFKCENNECVEGCDTDADCEEEEVCSEEGQCVEDKECETNADCGEGEICEDGTCEPGECMDDDDCGLVEICNEETYECETSNGKVMLLAILGPLGLLLLMLGLCPAYYVNIGGIMMFIGFGLLGNIHKFSEGIDFINIPLRGSQPQSLKIAIAEHVKELLHINTLKLRAVFHEQDEQVYVDQHKDLKVVKNTQTVAVSNYNFSDYALLLRHMTIIGKFFPNIEEFRRNNMEMVAHASDRFDEHMGVLFNKIRQRSAAEFNIPEDLLTRAEGELVIITDAHLTHEGMSQRLPIFDDIPQSEVEAGYEFFYNSPSYIHQEVTDFLHDFTGISCEVWDNTKQKWIKVKGSFIQEGQNAAKAFTIPKASKVRLITRAGAYHKIERVFVGISNESGMSDVILSPTSLKTKIDGVINNNPELLDMVSNQDDRYIRIDKDDQIEADFDLSSVWKAGKNATLFIENVGYYEVNRTLKEFQ